MEKTLLTDNGKFKFKVSSMLKSGSGEFAGKVYF
jgi:hypothetical protein